MPLCTEYADIYFEYNQLWFQNGWKTIFLKYVTKGHLEPWVDQTTRTIKTNDDPTTNHGGSQFREFYFAELAKSFLLELSSSNWHHDFLLARVRWLYFSRISYTKEKNKYCLV